MNRSHCIKGAFFVQFDIVILTKNNLLAQNCNVLLSYCHKPQKMFSLILLNINRIFTSFLIMRLFWFLAFYFAFGCCSYMFAFTVKLVKTRKFIPSLQVTSNEWNFVTAGTTSLDSNCFFVIIHTHPKSGLDFFQAISFALAQVMNTWLVKKCICT